MADIKDWNDMWSDEEEKEEKKQKEKEKEKEEEEKNVKEEKKKEERRQANKKKNKKRKEKKRAEKDEKENQLQREVYLESLELDMKHICEEEEAKEKWSKMCVEIHKKSKSQSDAAGGDDPDSVPLQDVGPSLIFKGFSIDVPEDHFDNGVIYNGVMTEGYLSGSLIPSTLEGAKPRSLIIYGDGQLDMETIERMGESNSHYLFPKEWVNCEVKGKLSKLMVTEEMWTVAGYFENELKFFLKERELELELFSTWSKEDQNLSEWLKYISSKFISIFSDLIQALLDYYQTNESPIGNLEKHIFVTKSKKKIRLLPPVRRDISYENDTNCLRQMMIDSILPPILEKASNVKVEEFASFGVKDFLSFTEKTRHLNSLHCSIIDHPLIWSPANRVSFMRKLAMMCKTNFSLRNSLDKELENLFSRKYGINYSFWNVYISNPVLKKIFEKPTTPNSKGTPYTTSVDIVRFHNAAYSHYNEPEYKRVRSKLRALHDVQIDDILNSYFPELYMWLKTLVFDYATNRYTKQPTNMDRELLEDLYSFKH